MLVLSRKVGQKVILTVGDVTISVTLIELQLGRVRLGFAAPHSVSIHREEVYEEIRRERSEDGRPGKNG